MKKQEMISVLMCVYNENIAIVNEAIQSIITQTYNNIELVIVIDNPQRNDVIALINNLKSNISINYILNETNKGLPNSLNIGVNVCQGKYIARMDADDIALPERLERQMQFLLDNSCDLVGCYMKVIDESGEIMGQRKDYPIHDQSIKKMLSFKSAIPHPTWLLKHELINKLGGYRNIYSSEDYDFLVRGVLIGSKYGVLPEYGLQYRINRNGITQRNLGLQKLLIPVISGQYTKHKIKTEEDFLKYIEQSEGELRKSKQFFEILKREKRGFRQLMMLPFYKQFYREIYEKIWTKIILWKDKHGYY